MSQNKLAIHQIPKFLEKAGNSFVVLDKNGNIEWANRGFYSLYGYSEEDYLRKYGNVICSLFVENDFTEVLSEISESQKPKNLITQCRNKQGEYIWIHSNITPFLNGEEMIERLVVVETDITQLKETEEEFKQQKEHMLSMTEYLEEVNKQLEQQALEIEEQRKEIEEEQERAERLLQNMFPKAVAHQLKKKGKVKPRTFDVTVLFADFQNFTKACEDLAPTEIVEILNSYFEVFDDIVGEHFVEKIKTIGDAYLCVGGLPFSNKSHAFDVILVGLKIQKYMNELNMHKLKSGENIWELRCGIHSGEVVAGVVGKRKYVYDIWGDTVNIASRMETHGAVGMVNISGDTYEIVKDYFDCTYRGKIEVKNKGKVDMYFVNGIKPEMAADTNNVIPNDIFRRFLASL